MTKNKNKKNFSTTVFTQVTTTGLAAGLIWIGFAWIASCFHFVQVKPQINSVDWFFRYWINITLEIVIFTCASIGFAWVYYFLFRKWSSIIISAAFGLIAFYLFGLMAFRKFFYFTFFLHTDKNTLITYICLFILYGVFIGVTLSYEEEQRKKT
jgi:hypothetical protein